MSLTQFTEILDAIRGISFGPREADELRAAIDCRVGAPPKSTATAECALAAVYAAIEQQAGHQDANLTGLAALVTALKPRTLTATGMTSINVPDDARLGMTSPNDPFPNRPRF